jgi:hypothetical protein
MKMSAHEGLVTLAVSCALDLCRHCTIILHEFLTIEC